MRLMLWRAWATVQQLGTASTQAPPSFQRSTPPADPPTCSVVIPTYNERENVVSTVRTCCRLAARPDLLEIVVVDGGSTDGTIEALEQERTASHVPLRLLSARGGRGHALRAGTEAARGDVLLMLHAECTPPPHYDALCAATLADSSVVLGAFSFRIDRSSFQKVPPFGIASVERFANVRSHPPFSLPYGDQGLHLRAEDLRAIGGVPAVAIMEDVTLVRKLLAAGAQARPVRRMRVRPEAIGCSGRRWERHGVAQVTVLNQLFMLAFSAGFSPDDIYTAYYGRPPPKA